MTEAPSAVRDAVRDEALRGLASHPKTLSPWLFYDAEGSRLFEQITALPEYYLTRTERALFSEHCAEILEHASGRDTARLTLVELGAGSAAKTGILLRCAVERQGSVLYQPVDVSASALDEAAQSIAREIAGIHVRAQVANYVTEPFTVTRGPHERVLALYIGSSIGNFSPAEATAILRNLHAHLEPGDALLLGADLAPGEHANGHRAHKSVATLLAAYNDAAGVTAQFNKNVLTRLNRELDADFDLDAFTHRAIWNPAESRIEMHLESLREQTVHLAGQRFDFAAGETIHTENSCKFTDDGLRSLLASAGFAMEHLWHDANGLFAVTLSRRS
jgi:dimethylhistidine N-methyltransferase